MSSENKEFLNDLIFVAQCCRDEYNGLRVDKLLRRAAELIKNLQADKDALIAGQETLQKALAEKDAKTEAWRTKALSEGKTTATAIRDELLARRLDAERIEKLREIVAEQDAEIERLQKLLEGWKTEAYKVADEKDKLYCEAVERVRTAKSEAYKEIIEKLKSKLCICDDNFNPVVTEKEIDDTFKEMVAMINEKHI